MSVRAVIASLALLWACGAQAEEPQWLQEARAREGKTGAPQ